MSDWPTLDRSPVDLHVLLGQDEKLWMALLELTEIQLGAWTLIGGQMVLLHAVENGRTPPRVSLDLDILVNARLVAVSIPGFVASVEERGFVLEGISAMGIGHRYVRDGVSIDILAPEGLGRRADLGTTPPGRTIEVPGGSQALKRTELVPVVVGKKSGRVPRPSLLGAVVGKAVAVDVDDVPEAQRQDLVFLLSLVDDPLEMRELLDSKDRLRLRKRSELQDREHRSWLTLDIDARQRGYAAFRILTADQAAQ